jgi:hypothetical protein
MSKERLMQLQFALFFDNVDNRPDKLISKIDEALDGVFDQIPTILPIPSDAPPEIPRVNMVSSNGVYLCNIAKNRIDFIVNYMNSGNSVTVNLENFIKMVHAFSETIFRYKNIVRFGFVGRYFINDNDPVNKIQSKYLKREIGDLHEISIRYNKRFERDGLVLNDVIEINQGNIVDNGIVSQVGISVQRDINNVPVDSLNFEKVMSIVSSCENKFKLSAIMELL